MTEVDLIIKNAHVFNVYLRKFLDLQVSIKNGKFYWINKELPNLKAKKVIDLQGKYLIPGFVDAHMHIDSSMTTPKIMGETILKYGTTTIIADDHEVTNVAGIKGLKEFINEDSPIDIFFGIPSSVPSTNPEMETTGGKIGVAEVKELLKDPRFICLGEVMNFKDMTSDKDTLIKNIINTCHKIRPTMPIEGHTPAYNGEDLAKILYAGVSTDHTQQTKKLVDEKLRNGMFVEVQLKSMHSDVINTIINNKYFEHVALVTDDSMPDTLLEGHLNLLVKKAIKMGMRPEDAIYISTYTPARHMGLWDRGAIAPGRVADFSVLDNLKELSIIDVYKNGRSENEIVKTVSKDDYLPESLINTVKAYKLNKQDLLLKTDLIENGTITANVIQINPVGTFTNHIQKKLAVHNGIVDWKSADLALIIVQERFGLNKGRFSLGLIDRGITGDGAVGATWAHDHHNLMVMGTNLDGILNIQHKLINQNGGYMVAKGNEIIANAPLPIGGVVSNQPIKILGEQVGNIRKNLVELGYKNTNEIMSFSTLSLLVSPNLKISDKGLFEVKSQRKVPLLEK
ncbi:adenine deaminase C-terminal domain-containing protein [Lactobacillus helveticus]|uniref:adenine deaminase C-terminal domain-containing protein n=2 Tax=Lactobacillus helveticus TaxID=1587 RepID=UPI00156260B0|nr:adenine deaminase C-terminal domain-containing protein [Lactobacillus helveticus]MBW8009560.1 adenosine deaminase [Lactobacillus helveticus]MBW8019592.1 adenosine deaminase [Lactobacillus helveticus]MBW8044189.1 adenosine deaminase [Lactobacillus helveticus]MBW8053624.1 adenosine deaminase [Lactobacillus helveticus]NRN73061.1 Adenine deaminase [Lactobacillus helveticus]